MTYSVKDQSVRTIDDGQVIEQLDIGGGSVRIEACLWPEMCDRPLVYMHMPNGMVFGWPVEEARKMADALLQEARKLDQ